jgi:diacylglycerol kinase (ATP)
LSGENKRKHARIIVNPAAGAGKSARRWLEVRDCLKSRGFPFEHRFTEAPGHAAELAREAFADSCETVVAVGGDGTVHEVVNGLHDAGGLDDVSLGIIGTGTGGDYQRSLGLSRDYDEACSRLISPQSRRVDLGLVEYGENGRTGRRCFVNFAGIGFDAETTRATNGRFKALGAMPSYLLGLLTTFVIYRNRRVSLRLDGEAEERKVCTVIAGIGRYGGGGMMTTPDAELDDGLFDVLIVDDIGKLELLRALPTIYKGTHLSHPRVTVKRARRLEVTSGVTTSLQADGELLGEVPAVFSVLPGALRLVV